MNQRKNTLRGEDIIMKGISVPDFNVFLQKSEKGIDLDFSSCYNLFRITFGRKDSLGKLAVRNQTAQDEKLGNVLVKCGTDIYKEREVTKRYEMDKYAEIIKDPNVSDDIKTMLAERMIELDRKYSITDSVVVGCAICASFFLMAYGVKNAAQINFKKCA